MVRRNGSFSALDGWTSAEAGAAAVARGASRVRVPPTSVILKAETVETLVSWGLLSSSLLDTLPPNGLAVLNGPRSLHLRSGVGLAEVLTFALERRGIERLPDHRGFSHATNPAAFCSNWQGLWPHIEALGIWVGDTWGRALERGEAEAVGRLIDLIAERQVSYEQKVLAYDNRPLPSSAAAITPAAAAVPKLPAPEAATHATEMSSRNASASWLPLRSEDDNDAAAAATANPTQAGPVAAAAWEVVPEAGAAGAEVVDRLAAPSCLPASAVPAVSPQPPVAAPPHEQPLELQQQQQRQSQQLQPIRGPREQQQVPLQQGQSRPQQVNEDAVAPPPTNQLAGAAAPGIDTAVAEKLIECSAAGTAEAAVAAGVSLKQAECQSEPHSTAVLLPSIGAVHLLFSPLRCFSLCLPSPCRYVALAAAVAAARSAGAAFS